MEPVSELYSETSSDDQSSINSVIHIESFGDVSGENSAPTSPERQRQNRQDVRKRQIEGDDDSSSDSGPEGHLRDRNGEESDSSTSSEETQIWVQNSTQTPMVPPKPSYRSNISTGQPSTSGLPARHSMVSQCSSSGKVETMLLVQTEGYQDPGVSHQDPQELCHSSGDSGLHSNPPSLRDNFPHSTPHSQAPPHNTVHYHHSPVSHASHASPTHIVTLPTIRSVPGSPSRTYSINGRRTPTSTPAEIRAAEAAQMSRHVRESLYNILSGLYALLLVVLGAVLPLAEVFAKGFHKSVFEGFYIYLFCMSILFLVYVYIFLLRTHTNGRPPSSREPTTSDALIEKSPTRRRGLPQSSSHTGSFYLRLGAVGFGIGAMIHEGLMFGQLFEFEWTSSCIHVVQILRPAAQLVFVFAQLYFIFLNSKMCIYRYRVLARFGLMHMMATNICIWTRTVIMETIRDIRHLLPGYNYTIHYTGAQSSPLSTAEPRLSLAIVRLDEPVVAEEVRTEEETITLQQPEYWINGSDAESTTEPPFVVCWKHDLMGGVVEGASPYLYPCTIEYSLIAAGILYVMWRNLSHQSSRDPGSADDRNKKPRNGVDCRAANKGLFLGIFTLVATIISVIVFFVLVEKAGFRDSAVMILHIAELVLYCLSVVAIAIAAFRMRRMRFHWSHDILLEQTLLIVSVAGIFIFSLFNIIAGRYINHEMSGSLLVATSVLIMIQSAVQTVFILNSLRRSSSTPYHFNKKPGREYITYILVCNIAMWGINTFEVMRSDSNPVASEFYGAIWWSIVSHISVPLSIFYRFHSTVCLADVWRNAYKQKTQ